MDFCRVYHAIYYRLLICCLFLKKTGPRLAALDDEEKWSGGGGGGGGVQRPAGRPAKTEKRPAKAEKSPGPTPAVSEGLRPNITAYGLGQLKQLLLDCCRRSCCLYCCYCGSCLGRGFLLRRRKYCSSETMAGHADPPPTTRLDSVDEEDLEEGKENGGQVQDEDEEEGKVKETQAEILTRYIRENIVGGDVTFKGPFGRKQIMNCDFEHNGRSLSFIEACLQRQVAPMLSNDNSTTTVTALQTTMYIDEVRNIICNAMNAGPEDELLVLNPEALLGPVGSASWPGYGSKNGSGSGRTLGEYAMRFLIDRVKIFAPVIFVSPQTHSATLMPWVESGGLVVTVGETEKGQLDVTDLRAKLGAHRNSERPLIGYFSAASDVTGVLNEDLNLTALLHLYGALAFWDYSTAASYANIDMNPDIPDDDEGLFKKDAIFFNMSSFSGGLQTCNLLLLKKALIREGAGGAASAASAVSAASAAVTVQRDATEVLAFIRSGLVVQLKMAVGAKHIMARQDQLAKLATERLGALDNVHLLGNQGWRRLGTLALVIKNHATGLYLHHNYVAALFNDLFGIQTRTADINDHSYAQSLFGFSDERMAELRKIVSPDGKKKAFGILYPGYVQLDLPWFALQKEVEFVLDAITLIATNGWQLLPQYNLTKGTGEWHHQSSLAFSDRKCLSSITYANGRLEFPGENDEAKTAFVLDDAILKAKETIKAAKKVAQNLRVPDHSMLFNSQAQSQRWFMLPSEAKHMMTMFKKFGKPWADRLNLVKYPPLDLEEEIVEINPIGTLAGDATFPKSLKDHKPEKKKAPQRGYWLTLPQGSGRIPSDQSVPGTPEEEQEPSENRSAIPSTETLEAKDDKLDINVPNPETDIGEEKEMVQETVEPAVEATEEPAPKHKGKMTKFLRMFGVANTIERKPPSPPQSQDPGDGAPIPSEVIPKNEEELGQPDSAASHVNDGFELREMVNGVPDTESTEPSLAAEEESVGKDEFDDEDHHKSLEIIPEEIEAEVRNEESKEEVSADEGSKAEVKEEPDKEEVKEAPAPKPAPSHGFFGKLKHRFGGGGHHHHAHRKSPGTQGQQSENGGKSEEESKEEIEIKEEQKEEEDNKENTPQHTNGWEENSPQPVLVS